MYVGCFNVAGKLTITPTGGGAPTVRVLTNQKGGGSRDANFVTTFVGGVSESWGRADKDDTGGNLTWMAAKLETAPDSSAVGVVVQAVVLS